MVNQREKTNQVVAPREMGVAEQVAFLKSVLKGSTV